MRGQLYGVIATLEAVDIGTTFVPPSNMAQMLEALLLSDRDAY